MKWGWMNNLAWRNLVRLSITGETLHLHGTNCLGQVWAWAGKNNLWVYQNCLRKPFTHEKYFQRAIFWPRNCPEWWVFMNKENFENEINDFISLIHHLKLVWG